MVSIYKLVVDGRPECYIGSTSIQLNIRFNYHKYTSKNYKQGNRPCSSKILFELGEVKIILIEECDEKNRTIRERYWIDNTPNVVNKQIPSRSKRQWRIDNISHVKENDKQLYEKKKEILKEPIECSQCNKILTRYALSRHTKTFHS